MGNCLLSDTNTLDMDDLTDLVPAAPAPGAGAAPYSAGQPHIDQKNIYCEQNYRYECGGKLYYTILYYTVGEWDVFNMRPGGAGCGGGGGGRGQQAASGSGVVSARAGK